MDEKNWKQNRKQRKQKTKVSEQKKPKPKGIFILGLLLSFLKISYIRFAVKKSHFCNFVIFLSNPKESGVQILLTPCPFFSASLLILPTILIEISLCFLLNADRCNPKQFGQLQNPFSVKADNKQKPNPNPQRKFTKIPNKITKIQGSRDNSRTF